MTKQALYKTLIILFSCFAAYGCAQEKNTKAVDDLIKSDQEKQDSFKKALEEKRMKLD